MKKLRILLRDFRTVVKDGQIVTFNIGTTAHAPGTAALLQKVLPECEIVIWASAELSPPLQKMMERRFPDIPIVCGALEGSNKPLTDAAHWCDLLMIGSGTGIAVPRDVEAFTAFTSKPYGAAGIGYADKDFEKIQQSDFVFYRDTIAWQQAKAAQVTVPGGFVPDGAFAFDAYDEAAAAAFMQKYGLESGKFVCCLPRYRTTPRWEFFPNGKLPPEEVLEYNRSMVRFDMTPLVESAVLCVRKLGIKVVLSPETEPAIRLCQNELYQMFPDDIKPFVVVPDAFWEADLALGVYRHSCGVYGTEMHSQVMAVGNGVPAIVCRSKDRYGIIAAIADKKVFTVRTHLDRPGVITERFFTVNQS